jgi:hypothetical protein
MSRRNQHSALCFERAFPQTAAQHLRAWRQLRAFEDLPIYYAFSFEVARWLARRCPGEVTIDWGAFDDTARLDEILRQIIQPGEDEYFDSGYVTTRDWIDKARAGDGGTDFDWLMAQLQEKPLRSLWTQLYDAAEIPLRWNPGSSRYSISRNALSVRTIMTRQNGMRGRPRQPKQAIMEPVHGIRLLSPREGARLVDIAMASLATRHRETWHFNYANPKEVYVADVGEGVSVAMFGLLAEYRYPLECTMGFLALSNGVPIGYGGSSILFKQVNTGINVFDEYRGSEAAYLFTQVMRVYHALSGCNRFIANAYQFGGNNDEALRSGAFWFYYRLGYRPVLADVRKLALLEAAQIKENRSYRSNIGTLRKLASCDMHLTLPGARSSDLFDEEWLITSSMLASRILGVTNGRTHDAAADTLAKDLARAIGIRNLDKWTPSEWRALKSIAPVVALADPESWSREEKYSLRRLLRAKGASKEAPYAKLLSQHDKLLSSLRNSCVRASAE